MIQPYFPNLTIDQNRMDLHSFRLGAANEFALNHLLNFPNWPHCCTILSGNTGSGKTHLTHIWRDHLTHHFDDKVLYLYADAINEDNIMGIIHQYNRIIIEDIKADTSLNALFHALNHVRDLEGGLLLTSQMTLKEIAKPHAELLSRIISSTEIEIDAPDDALIMAILEKLFSDRYIKPSQSAIQYLLIRMRRDYQNCVELVRDYDKYMMENGVKSNRTTAIQLFHEQYLPNLQANNP